MINPISFARRLCSRIAFVCVVASAFPISEAARADPTGCDAGEIKMRYSHVSSPTKNLKGEAAAALAAAINEELDGRACMIVYPKSELFTDNEVMQALLDGEVEFASPSIAKLEPFTKKFRIFDMPFLFKDFEALEWFQHSGPGVRLRRSLQPLGFYALAFLNNGMRQISANKPLLMPQDASGVIFRVQFSEVLVQTFKLLDAEIVKLPFKDVRQALADGKVNGQINTWSNIYNQKFHLHQDGITEMNHSVVTYIVVTSARFWEGLPKDLRRDISRIVNRVAAQENSKARAIDQRSKAALISEGVPIRELTPEQRAAWVEAMRPIWERYADEIGQQLMTAAISANR